MVYENHGDLYLQDGTKPSIQRTHSGKDRDPILSDDGGKIVFYRGDAFDNVYSINADGSKEQALIKSKSLPVLGRGDVKNLTFVPGTHYILFNTYICNPQVHLYVAADCTVGIYIVDTDSAKMSELVAGLHGDRMQGRNFEVSPNGTWISVADSGHVDIYSLNLYSGSAEIWIPDVILYNRTKPNEFLPQQYWLPDSSGVIAIIASDLYNEPGTPPQTYAAFRYKLYDKAIQIPLDPSPMWVGGFCYFSVSPDRNWIIYINGNETISVYLGDLNDGQVENYVGDDCSFQGVYSWSPDSRHFSNSFLVNGSIGAVDIGAVDGPPLHIGGIFVGWIDASHYVYDVIKDKVFVETRIGEIGGQSMALPKGFHWSNLFVVLPPKTEP